MNILSIDQSISNSGIAICNGKEIVLDCIKTKPGKPDLQRYVFIRSALLHLIMEHNIEVVVLEGYAYGAAHRAQQSGELGATIKLMCLDHKENIPCITVPIGSHKKFTTGKGNTKKDLMLKAVYKAYAIDTDNDNIADAVSILKTFQGYLCHLNGTGKFNIKQLESFKAVEDSIIREGYTVEQFKEKV